MSFKKFVFSCWYFDTNTMGEEFAHFEVSGNLTLSRAKGFIRHERVAKVYINGIETTANAVLAIPFIRSKKRIKKGLGVKIFRPMNGVLTEV